MAASYNGEQILTMTKKKKSTKEIHEEAIKEIKLIILTTTHQIINDLNFVFAWEDALQTVLHFVAQIIIHFMHKAYLSYIYISLHLTLSLL